MQPDAGHHPSNAEAAILEAATAQVLGTQGDGRRNWLLSLPTPRGPPTQHAVNIKHWMHFILIAQLVLLVGRLLWLVDFLGTFWMCGVFALGVYAYRQDMNITYISVWGIVCLLNGLLDIVAMLIPLALGLLSLDFLGVLIRVCTPLSELMGAAFAWNVYCDFLEAKGQTPPYGNPFKRFFSATDPERRPMEAALMMGKETKAAIKTKLHQQEAQQQADGYGAVVQGQATAGPATLAHHEAQQPPETLPAAPPKEPPPNHTSAHQTNIHIHNYGPPVNAGAGQPSDQSPGGNQVVFPGIRQNRQLPCC